MVEELDRFDIQLIENPENSGVEYQQGTLVGCEIREYLLAKWGANVPIPRATSLAHRWC
jgi:hypothetical protein